MRIVGVIAEYNPFHQGHAWQLRRARELAQADAVVVVMSSCFTQRGEAALLSPADRAHMALACGADAVFALPAVWSVRDAEHFALGGVAILHALGVDALSFGAETADVDQLWAAARLLEQPSDGLSAAVQGYLSRGLPWPEALAAAAGEVAPGTRALLSSPNNTLAVCYLRAMLRLGASMEICPVPRQGDYHGTAVSGAFSSATALRGAILRGDWQGVQRAMPEKAYAILQEAALHGRLHRPEALDRPLLYRLRGLSSEDLAQLPDLSEGIEQRLRGAALAAASREDMLGTAKTRRYPYARLSRLSTHALLDFTADLLAETPLPPAAWLLGLRDTARPLMARLSASGFPIIAKAADCDRAQSWFQAELRAYDVWALGVGLPAGYGLQMGVINQKSG